MKGIDIIVIDEKFKETPFKVNEVKEVIVIGNLDTINKLDNRGRDVLRYVVNNLDKTNTTTKLSVKEIASEFIEVSPSYFESKTKSIRRGIRNLILHNVLAKSDKRDIYWVNKTIVWK